MSARSRMSVFALEMSRPVSMIVVQTRTSSSFSQNARITWSSWCSFILPCATPTRASGTSSRSRDAVRSIVSTLLCT